MWKVPWAIIFGLLLLYVGNAHRSEKGKQLILNRKGGRTLILVSLDGSVTSLSPEDGKKMVRSFLTTV
jgi:hypothetical protein